MCKGLMLLNVACHDFKYVSKYTFAVTYRVFNVSRLDLQLFSIFFSFYGFANMCCKSVEILPQGPDGSKKGLYRSCISSSYQVSGRAGKSYEKMANVNKCKLRSGQVVFRNIDTWLTQTIGSLKS